MGRGMTLPCKMCLGVRRNGFSEERGGGCGGCGLLSCLTLLGASAALLTREEQGRAGQGGGSRQGSRLDEGHWRLGVAGQKLLWSLAWLSQSIGQF